MYFLSHYLVFKIYEKLDVFLLKFINFINRRTFHTTEFQQILISFVYQTLFITKKYSPSHFFIQTFYMNDTVNVPNWDIYFIIKFM